MKNWKRSLRKGQYSLSKRDLRGALSQFRCALAECPTKRPGDLDRIMFYLGVTLLKLDRKDCALKSWRVAVKMHKRGYSRKMYVRYSNAYGMTRQRNYLEDDREAFYSIQVEKYLQFRSVGRFGSEAEQDMIATLIDEYWQHLKKTGLMNGKSAADKTRLFRSVRIDFPLPQVPKGDELPIIQANFRLKTRMAPMDRCYCGSNLPFALCCGYTKSRIERQFGVF